MRKRKIKKELTIRTLIIVLYFSAIVFSLLNSLNYIYLTVDDSWITYKYARNLADGYGLVNNPGDPTQEGYSSLSLMLIMTFFYKVFNLHPIYSSKLLGILSLLGIFLITYFISELFFQIVKKFNVKRSSSQKLFLEKHERLLFHLVNIGLILGIGTSKHFAFWTVQGLETTFYSFIVLNIFYVTIYFLYTKKFEYFYVISILSFISLITRPEGLMNYFVFLFIVVFYCILNRKFSKEIVKNLFISILLFLVLNLCLFGFRYFYFGDFFSNPTYVKLGYRSSLNGYAYIINFFQNKGLLFSLFFSGSFIFSLIFIIYYTIRSLANPKFCELMNNEIIFLVSILTFLASQFFFIVYCGGDILIGYRFLVTHYPFIIYIIFFYPFIFVRLSRKIAIFIILLVVLVVYSNIILESPLNYRSNLKKEKVFFKLWPVLSYYKEVNSSYHKTAEKLQRLMENSTQYYALTEFGYISYNTNAKGIDMLGLNQKEIARNFKYYSLDQISYVNRDFVLSKKPRLVITPLVYRTDKGELKVDTDIGSIFSSYVESDFFLKHYEQDVPNETELKRESTYSFFIWKNNYNSTNKIEVNNSEHYDKLLYGFYLDGNWVAPLARVLIKPNEKDRFLNLEGYIQDIRKYKNQENVIEIRYNKNAVGDKIFIRKKINSSGNFKIKVLIEKNIFSNEDNLITLRGS